MNQKYVTEARLITTYLLSTKVNKKEELRYSDAMTMLHLELSEYEQALSSYMFRSVWKMGCIDAGLALTDPSNQVRRKVFTMLAILEASPNYTSYFLSRDFSFFYYCKLLFVGARAVFRALIGVLIIKNIRRKCQ